MASVIKIVDLINADIRSRNNAERIRGSVSNETERYLLDFSKVKFISRSFADELCNILENYHNVAIMEDTMDSEVKNVYFIVKRSRTTERRRSNTSEEVVRLKNAKEVFNFFCHPIVFLQPSQEKK